MVTEAQIQANRRNAQKSTGPRTAAGKAVTCLNALKTGIHAKSEVIPGEKPAELEALAAEYHDRFHPATPEQRFLVDTLVHAEWQLRRCRRVEAELWQYEIEDAKPWLKEDCPLGHVFSRAVNAFNRLQRRIDSAGRTYHRALQALQQLQSDPPNPSTGAPALNPAPSPPSLSTPEPAQPTPVPSPRIGFVSSPVPVAPPKPAARAPLAAPPPPQRAFRPAVSIRVENLTRPLYRVFNPGAGGA